MRISHKGKFTNPRKFCKCSTRHKEVPRVTQVLCASATRPLPFQVAHRPRIPPQFILHTHWTRDRPLQALHSPPETTSVNQLLHHPPWSPPATVIMASTAPKVSPNPARRPLLSLLLRPRLERLTASPALRRPLRKLRVKIDLLYHGHGR